MRRELLLNYKNEVYNLKHDAKNLKNIKERRLTMEAIGIVRRIDILGRMVIPMEIRRLQGIRTGDSIEIFADNEGNGSY